MNPADPRTASLLEMNLHTLRNIIKTFLRKLWLSFREIAQRRVFDFGSLGPYFNIESEYPQSGSQEGLRIPRSCVSIVAATVSLRRLATGADTAHAKATLVFLSERRSERLYAWQGAARPHGVLLDVPWRTGTGRRVTARPNAGHAPHAQSSPPPSLPPLLRALTLAFFFWSSPSCTNLFLAIFLRAAAVASSSLASFAWRT